MDAFLNSLTQTALPIIEQKRRVRLLGDFRGFVAQKRETGEAMRKHLARARKFGLERVAIFGASTLAKLQYKRLSSGIEVEFFDTKTEALEWLRRPRNLAA